MAGNVWVEAGAKGRFNHAPIVSIAIAVGTAKASVVDQGLRAHELGFQQFLHT